MKFLKKPLFICTAWDADKIFIVRVWNGMVEAIGSIEDGLDDEYHSRAYVESWQSFRLNPDLPITYDVWDAPGRNSGGMCHEKLCGDEPVKDLIEYFRPDFYVFADENDKVSDFAGMFSEMVTVAVYASSADRREENRRNAETPLDTAIRLIHEFLWREFENPDTDFSDFSRVPLAYTELGDNNEIPVQVYADLNNFCLVWEVGDRITKSEPYASLDEMNRVQLEGMTFESLVFDERAGIEF